MQGLKVVRVVAAAVAVALAAACGDGYLPTAPVVPDGFGQQQPQQPCYTANASAPAGVAAIRVQQCDTAVGKPANE